MAFLDETGLAHFWNHVLARLNKFVPAEAGKGLSSNDYTDEDKAKLASIESGANKTVVDSGLNSDSTNPVQNKVVDAKFTTVQADIDSKVPSSRKVNGKALTADITLSASDVGALPNTIVIPSIDGLATETYVNNKVAGLVDSAPDTLDTLNELAAALGDDPNFATTVANQIGGKVDKVDGKGLSTNDYTTTEKTKLASIADNAEVNQNAFSSIIVGSTTISADSKTDALTLSAGDNVTISADVDNDKITISTIDTTYSTGTSSISGLTKLYTTTGANTDGTMTQHSITSALGDAIQKVIPKAISITLAASGWNLTTKTQTVTVTGVLADETGQFITPTPSLSSQASYYDAGILCTGQASDSLTFTAETIPTENLAVYVTIQEVSV